MTDCQLQKQVKIRQCSSNGYKFLYIISPEGNPKCNAFSPGGFTLHHAFVEWLTYTWTKSKNASGSEKTWYDLVDFTT